MTWHHVRGRTSGTPNVSKIERDASAYVRLRARLAGCLPVSRLIDDPLRRLAYGTDASLYRLVPQLVVVAQNEAEVMIVLRECRSLGLPLTFRAAGTSLSGQAITDSVLVLLGDSWNGCEIRPGAESVRLQPGVIGAAVNRKLAPFGRKIGPDPASIEAAMIGGIVANNSSGMCCGTAQNSYNTLAGMRVVLLDGTVLDTEDAETLQALRVARPDLLRGLTELGNRIRTNPSFAARVRHKYRMKNTTGYGLNALLDFEDPIDMLTHLMIGSEGTLGFISAVTLRTVPEHADKASALILFDDLKTACEAVTALKATPVAAVELMDRAALRSVERKPGMPVSLAALHGECAALLVETRAPDSATLAAQIKVITSAIADIPTLVPCAFSNDPWECAKLWDVRKGMFPSVAATRQPGTTPLTEDVVFPVARLAEATLDTQTLLQEHGYEDAIIFGHALEGNLHFVFSPDFSLSAEIERYERFMEEINRLVIEKYDGALKGEHGTGRNMAPFVALEWGNEGRSVMGEIKALFDPDGLLNPGVILSDDPRVHLKHFKPVPTADPLIDKCMECGFCEAKCPSEGLTLSPRQRIVGWREIARLDSVADAKGSSAISEQYDYMGIDTCAACGLCETACPVAIDVGALIKAVRGRRVTTTRKRVARALARNSEMVAAGLRLGLGAADVLHGVAGNRMTYAMLNGARKLSGGRLPKLSPMLPRPVNFRRSTVSPVSGHALVYFPSCAARSMGTARGDDPNVALPEVGERLFRKAGYDVIYPPRLDQLCCGQPWESRGLTDEADRKARELEAALRQVTEEGNAAIVFDTSPCAYRMKVFLQDRLAISDSVEFVHDHVLPRVRLVPRAEAVTVHPVCSVRKMGTVDKLIAIAQTCSRERISTVDRVMCCGFAGEKGFNVPELNEHALRHLKASLPSACSSGYSTSRTCEIGLSEHAGFPYKSILYLVDACSVGSID